MEIDVVPNGEAPGGARLVPRTLELLRTPALDPFDLGLLEEMKFSRRQRSPFWADCPQCSVRRRRLFSR
jgi:hypothetical protein